MMDNRIYSTDQEIPGIIVNIISKGTRNEIPLSSPSTSSTYTIGGRSGIGLFDFAIDKPAIYELSASYPVAKGQQVEQTQDIVLAVVHSSVMEHIFSSIMGTVVGAMAIVFVPFAGGVAFIIIIFLKRRKARTRTIA